MTTTTTITTTTTAAVAAAEQAAAPAPATTTTTTTTTSPSASVPAPTQGVADEGSTTGTIATIGFATIAVLLALMIVMLAHLHGELRNRSVYYLPLGEKVVQPMNPAYGSSVGGSTCTSNCGNITITVSEPAMLDRRVSWFDIKQIFCKGAVAIRNTASGPATSGVFERVCTRM